MTCTLNTGHFFTCYLVIILDYKEIIKMKTNNINNTSFGTGAGLGFGLKSAAKMISIQEGGAGLSHVKFFQDTMTGLVPKAVFARSKADLTENSFLELAESGLVYYCPTLLGEKVFRKAYSNGLSSSLKNKVSKPASELLKSKLTDNKKLMPVKSALALSGLAIPLIEFTLNYIKNLMTLKMFKQGNFDNIANLDKSNKQDIAINNRVEKSAKKNIRRALGIFSGSVAMSILLIKKGHKSRLLQDISELILAPGTKLFRKNPKREKFFNKYFSLDFADNNGKLTMSKGQLTSCVLIGGAGYFGASKDRGKQNFLETLFRFPLVGFYIITGNELLEKGFNKLLYKSGKCKELINKDLKVPNLDDLKDVTKKIIAQKGGNYDEMYKKLLKQKLFIASVPMLFGIGVMGFFIAGTSNFFTKYRYNKEKALQNTRI